MHVMIDLETFGTGPNAPIAQIGAVAFEAKSGGRVLNGKAFNAYVREPMGVYDADTVLWWMDQSDPARRRLIEGMSENGEPLSTALYLLENWPTHALDCTWRDIEHVWAKPVTFDLPILSSAYRACGKNEPPWSYRAGRDVRTVYWLLGDPPEMAEVGVAHDAVDDCLYQICELQAVLGRLQS